MHKVGGKVKKKTHSGKIKGSNPKAFTFRSAIKAARAIRRFVFVCNLTNDLPNHCSFF